MDKESLLGIIPQFELIIRRIYYSKNPVVKIIVSIAKNKTHITKKSQTGNENKISDGHWENVKAYISSLGISCGDLIIVHSSAEELAEININPKEVLQYLQELVGEEGTLVMPCFPLYDEKNYDNSHEAYIYNPRRTICSTGMIPNLFLRTKGVIRSQFPWNSLAAKGFLAEDMMKHNLDTDLAHGIGSAWEFCMNHGAKILLLGVKSSHTTTMVHVAEDILDEKWPIEDWYDKKTFVIKDSSEERVITIRIRKSEWARYNASWYRSTQLKKKKILKERSIEGCNIGFIENSKAMVEFIIERSLQHKSFFAVPKRCYRNEK